MRRHRGPVPEWLKKARSERALKLRAQNPRCYTLVKDWVTGKDRRCGHGLGVHWGTLGKDDGETYCWKCSCQMFTAKETT